MRTRILLPALMLAALFGSSVSAADKKADEVIDKAIKALGGEEKLAKAAFVSWKTKGVLTIGDAENTISTTLLISIKDQYRGDFEGEFNGNKISGVTIFDGDKAWRKFGDNLMELDDAGVASEKRVHYLQLVPTLVVPLKGKGYKVKLGAEAKVNDKPAAVLEVTGPDDKDFRLYFDKETGLPVRTLAIVTSFGGDEVEQETNFSEYKDFGGIKKATKVEVVRDGAKFLSQTISDFKVVDKPDADAFKKPE